MQVAGAYCAWTYMGKLIAHVAFVVLLVFGAATVPISAAEADPQIRQTQEALKTLGYQPGPVDGVSGPKTQGAIRKFQSDAGLPVSGVLDAQTLRTLNKHVRKSLLPRHGPLAGEPAPPASTSTASVTDGLRQEAGEGARSYGDKLVMLPQRQWIRVLVVSALGLLALGIASWFVATIVGGLISFVLAQYVGLSVFWSLVAGAAAYFLPFLLTVLFTKPSITLTLAILIGAPIALASRYVLDSGWALAAVDGLVLMALGPGAIVRPLVKLGVIDLQQEPVHAGQLYKSDAPSQAASSPVTSNAPSTSSSSPITNDRRW